MKGFIKIVLIKLIKWIGKTKLGNGIFNLIRADVMEQTKNVTHNNLNFIFSVPNELNIWRVKTFSTKEPETLQWMDDFQDESIFWDIGANVGLYSCYAAKKSNCKVFAFEPSVFNLELLARNIYNNNLSNQVTIIPLPLSDSIVKSKLNLSSKNWGGAMSSFGVNHGQDGKPLTKIFEFQTLSLTMSDSMNFLQIPQPNYIKMDVDGIEHLILKGGFEVLKNVKEILVEIDESFSKQFIDSSNYLEAAGFMLKSKVNADISMSEDFKYCYNQIWIKSNEKFK